MSVATVTGAERVWEREVGGEREVVGGWGGEGPTSCFEIEMTMMTMRASKASPRRMRLPRLITLPAIQSRMWS